MSRIGSLAVFLPLLLPWQLPFQGDEPARSPAVAAIRSPAPGQALQGLLPIPGAAAGEAFASCEGGCSSSQSPRSTRFPIAESSAPVAESELARRQTTSIAEGETTRRLLVHLASGEQIEASLPSRRVRNDAAVEADTPAPTPGQPPQAWGTPAGAPTAASAARQETAPPPTPSPLPTNPGELSAQQIALSLGKGALAALAALASLALYQGFQSWNRRRRE